MSERKPLFPFVPWSKEEDFIKAAQEHAALNGWQPIETCLKAEYERVLLWDGDVQTGFWDSYSDGTGVWRERGSYMEISDVTHWMPLPGPPEEKS